MKKGIRLAGWLILKFEDDDQSVQIAHDTNKKPVYGFLLVS